MSGALRAEETVLSRPVKQQGSKANSSFSKSSDEVQIKTKTSRTRAGSWGAREVRDKDSTTGEAGRGWRVAAEKKTVHVALTQQFAEA